MVRRIIFLPIHTPSLLEMLPIAKRLAEEGLYEPVFFIFRAISGVLLDDLRSQGIRVIGPTGDVKGKKSPPPDQATKTSVQDPSWIQSRAKSLLRKALSTTILSFIWYFAAFGRQLRKANRILRQERAAAVIVIGDRHVGWETAFIRTANQLDIPSLIVPYAMSDLLPDFRSRIRSENLSQYRVQTSIEQLTARRFPTWVSTGQEEKIFFIPAGISLAAKFWGMMPDNPWVLGGGAASVMAVENPRMQEMFLAQGIPSSKMVVTGKPSVDQIFTTVQSVDKKGMRQSWGAADRQPVLLCAVPQLAEHGFLPWNEHWREIEFLISTFTAQSDAMVVLSLHPKSNPDNYRALAERFGAILETRRIYELLPAADIFVAMFSSTIMQAIGLGKPAIVVDFYGQNYTFYDSDEGVIVLHQREDLAPLLQRILSDRTYYDQLTKTQSENSNEWVLLDGKCTLRIMNLIYQTIEI